MLKSYYFLTIISKPVWLLSSVKILLLKNNLLTEGTLFLKKCIIKLDLLKKQLQSMKVKISVKILKL